jgi:DNA adenine methylase
LETLAPYWQPGYKRYLEPFAGSACLFFRLLPYDAVLADINEELILAYQTIRDAPDEVAAYLRHARPEPTEYYLIRSQTPATMDAVSRAGRFVYLNRLCFNGLYRTNSRGQFNVPFGGDRAGAMPGADSLRQYAAAIAGVTFRTGDFLDTLSDVASGDFVFLDPPYAVKAEWRRGLHYTQDSFAVDDVARLKGFLRKADRLGAAFVLSYADSDEGHDLARPYYSRTVSLRRSIAGSVFKRRSASELLISNRPHRAS